VITRVQLMALGITPRQLERVLHDGRLRALHRGVCLFGPNLLPLTREMAAVRACGPEAVLSYRSAGHVWQLLPYVPKARHMHVSVESGDPRSHPRIVIHRASLDRNEITTQHGIPITSPARTILDLATELGDGDLEQAIADAFARWRLTHAKLMALIDARPGHRGVARVRKQLEGSPARTRSRTERRLLDGLRQAGVPEPEANATLGPWEVDLLWRDQRLAVEVDGYDSHSSPRAFERDYRKTAALEEVGLSVLRVSADHVWNHLDATVARVRGRLGC
jgi:very-short-patch-repair endonuclease